MKKLSAFVLALLLATFACVTVIPVSAETTPSGTWDNYTSEPQFVSGSSNVYEIKTAEELAWVAQYYSAHPSASIGKIFYITENIDISAHFWVPIVSAIDDDSYWFQASLIGSLHDCTGGGEPIEIKGLSFPKYNLYSSVGLVGRLQSGCIKNICLIDTDINIDVADNVAYIGSFVGQAKGEIELSNLYTDADITITSTLDNKRIGGIVGDYTGGGYLTLSCVQFNGNVCAPDVSVSGSFIGQLKGSNKTPIVFDKCVSSGFSVNNQFKCSKFSLVGYVESASGTITFKDVFSAVKSSLIGKNQKDASKTITIVIDDKSQSLSLSSTSSLSQFKTILLQSGDNPLGTEYGEVKADMSWFDIESSAPSVIDTEAKMLGFEKMAKAYNFSGKTIYVRESLGAVPTGVTATVKSVPVILKGIQQKSGSNDIRIVAGLDSLEYDSVGYAMTVVSGGQSSGEKTVEGATVYESIVAAGKTLSAESLRATYLSALTLTGVPDADFILTVTAYVVLDGERLNGNTVAVTFVDGSPVSAVCQ